MHYISNPHLGPYIKKDSDANININSNSNSENISITNKPKPNINIKLNLLNNIKSGDIKLKKVNLDNNIKKDKIVSGPNVLKVPSLGDIQNALSNLKKINTESQSNI